MLPLGSPREQRGLCGARSQFSNRPLFLEVDNEQGAACIDSRVFNSACIVGRDTLAYEQGLLQGGPTYLPEY